MPTVLYSTTCYNKNDGYRLSICVDDNEQNLNNNKCDTDSADFAPLDISIDRIIPSLTRINLEFISDRKNTNIPKTIMLNHLLSVQQTEITPNKSRRYNNEFNYTNDAISITEQSQKTSHTTVDTTVSDAAISQTPTPTPTPTPGRQFDFRRLFSTPSNTDGQVNLLSKVGITINYVDVSNSIRWSIKTLKLQFKTEDIANESYVNLNLCLSKLKQRPRHLLAFVNPFGGKGRALYVYEKKILPIFTKANITVNSICTKHANEARDYVINEDLNDYDGLICVGGDGMFAELCHGLLLRTSREAQIDIDDPQVKIIRPDLRIGIIPAGSTDAVVFGTTGLNDPVTSALQIIVGESLSIDIATVHNEKGFVRFMATLVAYGFFGDIIHQSDKWRCLGPLRYDLAGFYQFIRNRSYHTELTMTLSSHDSSQTYQPQTATPVNHTNNGTILSAELDSYQLLNKTNITANGNNQTDKSYNVIDNIVTPALVFCRRNCETCALEETHDSGKVHSPLKIKREGRYTTINCLNMPGRCAKSKFGMSPFVHLGDGSFDLILVKRSWRTGFLRFLWQVANDGRSIEDLPNVERYRVSEVLIHPMHTDRRHLGNWQCDGELISGTEIQVRIHRQALNLFASGIQFDKLAEYNPIKTRQKKKTFFLSFQFKTSKSTRQ